MEPVQNATVYIVDDDRSVRDALAWLLRTRRLPSEMFDSAEAFDVRVSSDFAVTAPSCVLLDVRMAGLSGLAMFEKLIGYGLLPTLPVIFLTGHADVPTAVAAVKQGDVSQGKQLLQEAVDTSPTFFEAASRSLKALGG